MKNIIFIIDEGKYIWHTSYLIAIANIIISLIVIS